MKTYLAVLFTASLLVMSTPATAQVRPFSQLTAHALDSAQTGRVATSPAIHINLAGVQDREDGNGPDGDNRDQGSDHNRDNHNQDRDRDRNSNDQIGGWGGFGFGYFVPVLSGFDGLTEDRGLHSSFPALDTWAGRGFVTWNGVRFGGMGAYGSFHVNDTVQGDDRSAAIRLGYGGVTFDYLLPLGTDRVGLVLGGALGGGGTWISARGDDLGHDDYFAEYTGFRFFAPEAGISILAIPWARIELTAQYMFMDINLQGNAFASDQGDQLVDTSWFGGPIYTMWFLFGHD